MYAWDDTGATFTVGTASATNTPTSAPTKTPTNTPVPPTNTPQPSTATPTGSATPAPSFTFKKVVESASAIAPGATEHFTATIMANETLSNELVDFEVYNSAGVKVWQTWQSPVSFTANVARKFSSAWAIPAGQARTPPPRVRTPISMLRPRRPGIPTGVIPRGRRSASSAIPRGDASFLAAFAGAGLDRRQSLCGEGPGADGVSAYNGVACAPDCSSGVPITPASASARGSHIVNVVPSPSIDATSMRPPCAATISWQMNRPNPKPPFARARISPRWLACAGSGSESVSVEMVEGVGYRLKRPA